jgi:hypothetical protein
MIDKVVCETLRNPQQSDVFSQVDQLYFQPTISEVRSSFKPLVE